jgi:predicted permease
VRTGAGPDPSLESRTALWISGVAAIVLLIACANVANLHLARMLRRQRETAIRLSLGAGRSRLLAQALTESVVLAVLAAVGGLFVAHFGGAAIRRLLMTGADAAVGPLTDARTLVVTAVIALVVGILTGLAPAMPGGRANLSSSLRSGARGITADRGRLRTTLLVVQGALSVMLLVGATLFVRSLDAVHALRMGYDADRTLIVHRELRGVQLDAEARATLQRTLLERAQSLPSVEAASWVDAAPLAMTGMRRFFVPGVDSVARLGQFTAQETSADYFRSIGTRIVRGRGFTADDRRGAPNVVVVSESMARTVWPRQDAIGQCMRFGADTMPCTTVVGIAEDMVQSEITGTRLQYYLPMEQRGGADARTLILRVRTDPALEADHVRRALQQMMPGASYLIVQPMEQLVEGTRRPWRLGATMFVAFGALALVVAAVGLYGVIGYDVAQRMHELGVRVALGARRADVLRLVIGQSVRLTIAGVAIGSLLALAAARWLQPLLYQQSARDPVVYAMVATMLVIVAFVASASPAARAANADPNVVLRSD